MIVDIACVVFFVAITLKFRNMQKQVASLRSDLDVTMKNPAAAKRLLKERQ
tara:strand:+ start:2022 stop:2174 length:153 start_codon:yes stop_codon:yes gene_type:complete